MQNDGTAKFSIDSNEPEVNPSDALTSSSESGLLPVTEGSGKGGLSSHSCGATASDSDGARISPAVSYDVVGQLPIPCREEIGESFVEYDCVDTEIIEEVKISPKADDFYLSRCSGLLRSTREEIESGWTENELNHEILPNYREWVALPTVLLYKEINQATLEEKLVWGRASKRGNSIHRYRISKRINPILEEFEGTKVSRESRGIKSARVLAFTLTFSRDNCTVAESWNRAPKMLDNFLKSMRAKYGHIGVLWGIEAQPRSGYAHYQLIMIFNEHEFSTFMKNGKRRISSHREWRKIKNRWQGGYSDVRVVDDMGEGISYCAKYALKDTVNGDATLAICWALRKRQWAISSKFLDSIIALHNSQEKIRKIQKQTDLVGGSEPVFTYEFIAVLDAHYQGTKQPPPRLNFTQDSLCSRVKTMEKESDEKRVFKVASSIYDDKGDRDLKALVATMPIMPKVVVMKPLAFKKNAKKYKLSGLG